MKIGKCSVPQKVIVLTGLLLLPWFAQADDRLVVFGLTNVSINGASLSLLADGRGLHVDGLSDLGYKGVSVRLGEADCGLFFSPQLQTSPVDNNFMSAQAFTRIGDLEIPVSSIFCRRNGYGTFPTTVDFSALGSFSKTYQVFCDGVLMREETNSNGTLIFHADSNGNIYPRVNPFWRAPDGSVGVLVDFQAAIVSLPHGQAYGDRVFIKAERPLLPVDTISHVNIYGGGGLTHFDGWAEWLGMFNLAHQALGSAVFAAQNRVLSVGALGTTGEDGVMVELDHAASYEMRLKSLTLPTNGLVQMSAQGAGDSYLGWLNFLGPVSLRNSNGTAVVSGIFGADPTNQVRIAIFKNGLLAGSTTNRGGDWGTIAPGNWKITAFGTLPYSGGERSSIYVTFNKPVEFQPTGAATSVMGDQFRFSWDALDGDNGFFRTFQLQAAALPEFSITGESTQHSPPPSLSIARTGDQAELSWPFWGSQFSLETAPLVDGTYSYEGLPGAFVVGSRWQVKVPMARANQGYFRLNSFCLMFNRYLNSSSETN